MKIVMIGTGYVGLVSGACFADARHEVVGVDRDAGKIDRLHHGEIPIHEPGLDALVAANVAAGRLTFTTELAEALPGAEAIFLAVGTPTRGEDGHADLSYVFSAVDELAGGMTDYAVIVSKSTVPVGTGDRIEERIRQRRPDLAFDVASSPEFLREGSAIADFANPDRIVVGTGSERAAAILRAVYQPIARDGAPILFMSRRSAELTKYAANAFLATKITFINEIADFCEKVGADVDDVSRAVGLDPRIGGRFLQAGPGYGGSCFPKDTLALLRNGEAFGSTLQIVETVVSVNERRKRQMVNRIVDACGGSVAGRRIALLGVTFKPNTDDMRESPSIPIARQLGELGARLSAYDPVGRARAMQLPAFAAVDWHDDPLAAIDGADAAVIITEWDEFRHLDLAAMAARMAQPLLIDLRNVFRPDAAAAAGLTYLSIGRPRAAPAGADLADGPDGMVSIPHRAPASA